MKNILAKQHILQAAAITILLLLAIVILMTLGDVFDMFKN